MNAMLPAILMLSTLALQAQYNGRRGVRYINEGNVFTVRRTSDWSANRSDGRCTIRVRIDDDSDVELRGEQIRLRVIRGAPGRDEGSECNAPLPVSGNIRNFRFRGIDGRGSPRLVQEPASRNYYVAVVNVQDPSSGDEGYTFEFTWNWDEAGSGIFSERPETLPAPIPGIFPEQPGSNALPDMNTSVAGNGTLDDGRQRYDLTDLSVRVRGDRCEITLITNRQQRLEMTGTVVRGAPRCLIDSSNRGNTSANAYIEMNGGRVRSLNIGGNINGRNFTGSFRSR